MLSIRLTRHNASLLANLLGDRYDVGDKFRFMKTSIDYALKHPQIKDDLKQYLIDLGLQT